jgi:Lysylphosphatidylglycerol synthase TM region
VPAPVVAQASRSPQQVQLRRLLRGLGLVEASLTGLLVLAEVNSSQAVLATLAYRIASYWLPLCAGPIAYGLFQVRYWSRPSSRWPAKMVIEQSILHRQVRQSGLHDLTALCFSGWLKTYSTKWLWRCAS